MAAALESMAGSFMRHCRLARYVVRSLANSQGPLNEFAPVAMIKKMLVFFEPTRPDFQFLAILGRTFIHQNEELDKVSVIGLRRRHMLAQRNLI
jgi:hypothetical protein